MIEKMTLDNGVRIIFEQMPALRSVSMGIWEKAGSRCENSDEMGISHFLEHMLFKGTQTKSAFDIASSMDMIGGQINAFTTKECTCYHAKTLDTHMKEAFCTLSDMVHNPRLDAKDIETEKGVVIEEINSNEDSPDDLVTENLSEKIWSGTSLETPILGTAQSVNDLSQEKLFSYKERTYTPKNTVISVAGSFDKDEVIGLVSEQFGLDSSLGYTDYQEKIRYKKEFYAKEKNIEQNHICLAFNGLPAGHKDYYTLAVISNIFGGGLSSRLFQTVREQKGLAYSVGSFLSSYTKTGLFMIYAALNPNAQDEALLTIIDEIEKFRTKGISDDELIRGREQIKANLIMGMESSSSRMIGMGAYLLLNNKIRKTDTLIQNIDKVDKDAVLNLADKIFDTESMSFGVVGKTKRKHYKSLKNF